jgi:hypothetical protein
MLLFDQTISPHEKRWIRDLFKDFNNNENGHYASLQYLYNNHVHYTTVAETNNICSVDWIRYLAKIAKSRTKNIQIIGSVHTNYHTSGVLMDSVSHTPLFVRDEYIRVLVDGIQGFRHILVKPPNISGFRLTNQYYYGGLQRACTPFYFIPPTFVPE